MAKPELTIPQTAPPTLFNKDALMGAGLASIPGAILTGIVGAINPVAGAVTFAVSVGSGALIAGSLAKKKMQEEQVSGKIVSSPTLFNKQALGYGLGISALLGIAQEALTASFTSGGITGTLSAINWVQAAVLAVGTAYGAFAGKARMQQDYNQGIEELQKKAQSQAVAMQKAQAVLAGQEPELTNGKSHAEEQLARRQASAGEVRSV